MKNSTPKKNILFLTPYPFGEAPSQRFRFEQYKDFFESEGFSLTYLSFYSPKTWKILYKKGAYLQKTGLILIAYFKRFFLCFQLKKYDILFIHRELAPFGPPVFEFIISQILKKKYIYDFDDAIWLPNYSKSNAKFQWIKNYKKVDKCMKWATEIIAGNDYLATYARQWNPNVTIIPTTIDLENHHNLQTNYRDDKIIIGWTGTLTTMHYLDFIVPILSKLENEYDFAFHVISNKKPDFNLKSIVYIPWNKESEIKDLAKINIGIMPLKEEEWAKGKCGFKALQYMALGIPSIASPVGVNTEIIQHNKNGFLAHSPEEWESFLIQLIKDVELRKTIGKAGKKTVKEKYTVEANKEKYLQIFHSLIKG